MRDWWRLRQTDPSIFAALTVCLVVPVLSGLLILTLLLRAAIQ